jgi:hypothetical protein
MKVQSSIQNQEILVDDLDEMAIRRGLEAFALKEAAKFDRYAKMSPDELDQEFKLIEEKDFGGEYDWIDTI